MNNANSLVFYALIYLNACYQKKKKASIGKSFVEVQPHVPEFSKKCQKCYSW